MICELTRILVLLLCRFCINCYFHNTRFNCYKQNGFSKRYLTQIHISNKYKLYGSLSDNSYLGEIGKLFYCIIQTYHNIVFTKNALLCIICSLFTGALKPILHYIYNFFYILVPQNTQFKRGLLQGVQEKMCFPILCKPYFSTRRATHHRKRSECTLTPMG